jgi:hypothetical protein
MTPGLAALHHRQRCQAGDGRRVCPTRKKDGDKVVGGTPVMGFAMMVPTIIAFRQLLQRKEQRSGQGSDKCGLVTPAGTREVCGSFRREPRYELVCGQVCIADFRALHLIGPNSSGLIFSSNRNRAGHEVRCLPKSSRPLLKSPISSFFGRMSDQLRNWHRCCNLCCNRRVDVVFFFWRASCHDEGVARPAVPAL